MNTAQQEHIYYSTNSMLDGIQFYSKSWDVKYSVIVSDNSTFIAFLFKNCALATHPNEPFVPNCKENS